MDTGEFCTRRALEEERIFLTNLLNSHKARTELNYKHKAKSSKYSNCYRSNSFQPHNLPGTSNRALNNPNMYKVVRNNNPSTFVPNNQNTSRSNSKFTNTSIQNKTSRYTLVNSATSASISKHIAINKPTVLHDPPKVMTKNTFAIAVARESSHADLKNSELTKCKVVIPSKQTLQCAIPLENLNLRVKKNLKCSNNIVKETTEVCEINSSVEKRAILNQSNSKSSAKFSQSSDSYTKAHSDYSSGNSLLITVKNGESSVTSEPKYEFSASQNGENDNILVVHIKSECESIICKQHKTVLSQNPINKSDSSSVDNSHRAFTNETKHSEVFLNRLSPSVSLHVKTAKTNVSEGSIASTQSQVIKVEHNAATDSQKLSCGSQHMGADRTIVVHSGLSSKTDILPKIKVKSESLTAPFDSSNIYKKSVETASSKDSLPNCLGKQLTPIDMKVSDKIELKCNKSKTKVLKSHIKLNVELKNKNLFSSNRKVLPFKSRITPKKFNAYKSVNPTNRFKYVAKHSPPVNKMKSVGGNLNCVVNQIPSSGNKKFLNNAATQNLHRLSFGKSKKVLSTKYKVVNKNSMPRSNERNTSKFKVVNKTASKTNNEVANDLNLNATNSNSVNKKSLNVLSIKKRRSSLVRGKTVFNTNYKIVNKDASVPTSSIKYTKTKNANEIKGGVINVPKVNVNAPKRKSFNKNELNNMPELFGKKMSELNFIKSSEYIGYDLTDISPSKLCSLDPELLLKLSTLYKSKSPSVTASKYKIVSKNRSPANHAVRMIKTKYQSVYQKSNKKSFRPSPAYRRKSKGNPKLPYFSGNFKSNQFNSSYGNIPKYRKWPSRDKKYQTQKPSGRTHFDNKYKKTNFVMIGDIPYRVSNTKITRTVKKSPKSGNKKNFVNKKTVLVVRGIRFEMDPSGKSLKKLPDSKSAEQNKAFLKRIDVGGKTYIRTSPGVLTETTTAQTRTIASRVLNRSIQRVWAASAKKSIHKNVYCMFYNRFGKCNREINCPYIHDPSKIAVCTRFLRGTCKDENCPFSHKISPGKMAICSYFLLGACTQKDCPYRHESVEPGTELCKAFVRGYCPNGSQCKKAHILICPQYIQGSCKKGSSCLYPHPPQNGKRKAEGERKETTDLKKICKEDEGNESDVSENEGRYFTFKPFVKQISELTDDKKEATNDITEKDDCIKISTSRSRQLPVLPAFIPL